MCSNPKWQKGSHQTDYEFFFLAEFIEGFIHFVFCFFNFCFAVVSETAIRFFFIFMFQFFHRSSGHPVDEAAAVPLKSMFWNSKKWNEKELKHLKVIRMDHIWKRNSSKRQFTNFDGICWIAVRLFNLYISGGFGDYKQYILSIAHQCQATSDSTFVLFEFQSLENCIQSRFLVQKRQLCRCDFEVILS